jgi:hypothetical protein
MQAVEDPRVDGRRQDSSLIQAILAASATVIILWHNATRTSLAGDRRRFPGTKEGWNTLQQTTDAELFGRAVLWALGEDNARNEIFNVSNGDVYRWRQLRNELAAFYDLPVAEPLAMSTVSEMSEKAPLWDSMVARYGLHATSHDQIAHWAFVDWILNFGEATIQSTIKIRQPVSRIASIRTRASGGSSPDFANCASSPEQIPSYRAT